MELMLTLSSKGASGGRSPERDATRFEMRFLASLSVSSFHLDICHLSTATLCRVTWMQPSHTLLSTGQALRIFHPLSYANQGLASKALEAGLNNARICPLVPFCYIFDGQGLRSNCVHESHTDDSKRLQGRRRGLMVRRCFPVAKTVGSSPIAVARCCYQA